MASAWTWGDGELVVPDGGKLLSGVCHMCGVAGVVGVASVAKLVSAGLWVVLGHVGGVFDNVNLWVTVGHVGGVVDVAGVAGLGKVSLWITLYRGAGVRLVILALVVGVTILGSVGLWVALGHMSGLLDMVVLAGVVSLGSVGLEVLAGGAGFVVSDSSKNLSPTVTSE